MSIRISLLLLVVLASSVFASAPVSSPQQAPPADPQFNTTLNTSVSYTDPDSGVSYTLETADNGSKSLGGHADKATKAPKGLEIQFNKSDKPFTSAKVKGLKPNTKYYVYTDGYTNENQLTSDANGTIQFPQDTSESHDVLVQDQSGHTVLVGDETAAYSGSPLVKNGRCAFATPSSPYAGAYLGTWDSAGRTCKLDQDINDAIELWSDNIVLDCDNHKVGTSSAYQTIYLSSRSGVTVKNCVVNPNPYGTGIYVYSASNNNFLNNTINGGNNGFYLYYGSNYNNITGNRIYGAYYGIYDYFSVSNRIIGNTINGQLNGNDGIYLYYSVNNNIISDNEISRNYEGIYSYSSYGNAISNNVITNNTNGIDLYYGDSNNINRNRIYSNSGYNFVITSSYGNSYTHNYLGGELTCGDKSRYSGLTLDALAPYYSDEQMTQLQQAAPQNCPVSCGDHLSQSASLTSDLVCGGTALYLDSGNIALDCQGHSITINSNNYGVNGISVSQSGATIKNCNLIGPSTSSGAYGIYTPNYGTNYLNITGNNISNFQDGIYLSGAGYSSFTNNKVTGNQYGIYLYSSSSNTITGNTVSNGYEGIDLYYSNSNILSYNSIYSNSNYNLLSSSSSGNDYTRNYLGGELTCNDKQKYSGISLGMLAPYYTDSGMTELTPSAPMDCPVSCGDHLSQSASLTSDLVCGGTALYLDSGNIALDCQGHSITINSNNYGVNGITVSQSGATIKNCNLVGPGTYSGGNGIYSTNYGTSSLNITGNNITNFQNGIYLYGTGYSSFTNNKLTGNQYGLTLYSSSSNSINYNRIYSNSYLNIQSSYSSGNNLTLNYLGGELACSDKQRYSGIALDSLAPYYVDDGMTQLMLAAPANCPPSCGDHLTQNVNLSVDMVCSGTALYLDRSGMTLDCQGHKITLTGYSGGGVSITQSGVTVRNCNIVGPGASSYVQAIVTPDWSGVNFVNITGNNISNLQNAIYLGYYDGSGSVTNNRISNTQYGVYVSGNSNSNDISGNTFINNSPYGVYVNGNYNSVRGNVLSGPGAYDYHNYLYVGINNDRGQGNSFFNNTATNYPIGIIVTSDFNNATGNSVHHNYLGIGAGATMRGLLVNYNNASNNSWAGIYLSGDQGGPNVAAINNTVADNGQYGIVVQSTYRTGPAFIWTNNISGGEVGIAIDRMNEMQVINNSISGAAINCIQSNAELGLIQGNDISGCGERGVLVEKGSNNSIKGNRIANALAGIALLNGSNSSLISGNTIINSTDGIEVAGPYNRVEGNDISKSGDTGIYLQDASSSAIIGNTLGEDFYGIGIKDSPSNSVTGNRISAGNYSIFLVGSDSNSISSNNLTTYLFGYSFGTAGIHLESSDGNDISSNSLRNGDDGIVIGAGSVRNRLAGNSISGQAGHGIVLFGDFNNATGNDLAGAAYYGIFVTASNNTVAGNNVTGPGQSGIAVVSQYSGSNSITSNLVKGYDTGILLWMFPLVQPNNISSNNVQESRIMDLKVIDESAQSCNNAVTGNTGSGGRPILYAGSPVNVSGGQYSEVVLCGASGSRISDIVVKGSDSLNNNGIFLIKSNGSRFDNVTSLGNLYGIEFGSTAGNALLGSTLCNNTLDINNSGGTGRANRCDRPDGWNDTGYIGCEYACGYANVTDVTCQARTQAPGGTDKAIDGAVCKVFDANGPCATANKNDAYGMDAQCVPIMHPCITANGTCIAHVPAGYKVFCLASYSGSVSGHMLGNVSGGDKLCNIVFSDTAKTEQASPPMILLLVVVFTGIGAFLVDVLESAKGRKRK